jgi:hypothetical protein
MLQWNDGSWEHRAYWGENLIEWGTNGTASRQFMGALPRAGCWVRLEVPAVTVGLEGREVNGMSFVLWDGRATWDAAGLITRQPMNAATTERFAPSLFFDGGVDFSSALDAVAEE